jgi:predicted O-linked N-acetylglucosamine transferase (SPINDLY family)
MSRETLGIPRNSVVFYSCQNPCKRNPSNLRDQLAIVLSVPESVVIYKGGEMSQLESVVNGVAQEVGLSPERIRILPHVADQAVHRGNMRIADVVLDTFPYNGVTTTLEALWCGIPVVTQVGRQYAARCGASILSDCSLGDLIADSSDAYRRLGTRLGTDTTLLREVTDRCQAARTKASVFDPRDLAARLTSLFLGVVGKFTDRQFA